MLSPRRFCFQKILTGRGGVVQLVGTAPSPVWQNAAYNFTPSAIAGSGTKTFSLTGTLPTGLSFSTVTGAITGTPTVIATTSGLNISVTDSSGTASLGAFSIQVVAQLTISGTPGTGTVGSAYSFTPTVTGGAGTQTFALVTGTLPSWASFNTATGAITGTPDTAATTLNLSIKVTDASGSVTLGPFSIAVTGGAASLDFSDPNNSQYLARGALA